MFEKFILKLKCMKLSMKEIRKIPSWEQKFIEEELKISSSQFKEYLEKLLAMSVAEQKKVLRTIKRKK